MTKLPTALAQQGIPVITQALPSACLFPRSPFHCPSKATQTGFEGFPWGSAVLHCSPITCLTKICLRIVASEGSLPSQRHTNLQATNRTARKQSRHSWVHCSFGGFVLQKVRLCVAERLFATLNYKRENLKASGVKALWLLAKLLKTAFQAVKKTNIFSESPIKHFRESLS